MIRLFWEELAIISDPMNQVIINVLINSASAKEVEHLLDSSIPHHLFRLPNYVADPYDFGKDADGVVHVTEFAAETLDLWVHQIDHKY